MKIEDRINIFLNEMSKEDKLATLIRDNLSGTDRIVTKRSLFIVLRTQTTGLTQKLFDKVFKSLIDDDYIEVLGNDKYRWERLPG